MCYSYSNIHISYDMLIDYRKSCFLGGINYLLFWNLGKQCIMYFLPLINTSGEYFTILELICTCVKTVKDL